MDWIDQTRTRAIIGLLWLLTWIDKTWLNKTRIDIVSLSCQPAITFYLRFLETAEAWLPAAVRKCSRRIEGRTRLRDGGNQRCRRLLFPLLRAASPWNCQYSRIVIEKTETKQNKRSHHWTVPLILCLIKKENKVVRKWETFWFVVAIFKETAYNYNSKFLGAALKLRPNKCNTLMQHC